MEREGEAPAGVAWVEVGEGIRLAYEAFGDPGDPPVVLVMGLATQMLGWPDGFCERLAAAGHRVVRFDNRDVGLSTHLDGVERGDLGALLAGTSTHVAYGLEDMAADLSGLVAGLGLPSAHVVGASMGAMIAQQLAIDRPEQVRSLTSMFGSTGDRSVGAPAQAAVEVLLAPPARSRRQAIDRTLATYRVIGSKGFPFEAAALEDRAGRMYDRSYDPAGMGRQFAAVLVAEDRTAALRELDVPTLVVHGTDDALVDVSGGHATATAIPEAELVIVEGLGHDLPTPAWPMLVERIAAHVVRAEARAPASARA